MSSHFINVVQNYDVVPILLSLGSTIQGIVKATSDGLIVASEFAKEYSTYIKHLTKLAEKLAKAAVDDRILKALGKCVEILFSRNALKIGDQYTDYMYLPIGNYILFEEEESSSILNQAQVTNQVIDNLLQHAMDIGSCGKMLENHKLSTYQTELEKKKLCADYQKKSDRIRKQKTRRKRNRRKT